MAMKKSRFLVNVFNVALGFLMLLSLLSIGLYVYYKNFNKDITIGVNLITDQVAIDDAELMSASEREKLEARCLLEANYYSNDNNNGIELNELKINYFTDYTLTQDKYRSTGMQFVGNIEDEEFLYYKINNILVTKSFVNNEGLPVAETIENYVDKRFNYYDSSNGINFNGYTGHDFAGSVSSKLNFNSIFTIKIDDEPYAIQCNNVVNSNSPTFLGIQIGKVEFYASWGGLMKSIVTAIKNSDKSYGDYFITLDLSEFLTVKKYDVESGKFLSDDVTDIIKNYAVLKFHYDKNGAKNVNQSIFGVIDYKNAYGLTPEDLQTTTGVEYWKMQNIVNLTRQDLKARTSTTYGGDLLSMPVELKSKLSNTDTKVNVLVDTSGTSIVGLDYNAFKGVKIDTLTIIGSGRFTLLESCLKDTNIKQISHQNSIDIVIADNATNNNYNVEVLR